MKAKLWLVSALAIAAFPLAAMAQANATLPKARIIANGEQLRVRSTGQTYVIDASDLEVQVLNAVDCDRAEVAERQTLSGQRFVDGSVTVDRTTGNVAVGVLLQECYETQTSAVFVIDPQSSAYGTYRVQVPGTTTLPDEFSTYPLSSITAVGYLQDDLLVKHADASGSEALLVFSAAATPAGEYAGCLYTEFGEGDRLCPPD